MKASKRQHKAQQPDAVLLRLEALAEQYRPGIAYWLADCSKHYQAPGLVLMFAAPSGRPTAQPLDRDAVLDMARALGLGPAADALGPLSPVLVMGEGRAVLLGSAIGATPPIPPVTSRGGAA